jgi:hypothetical protein
MKNLIDYAIRQEYERVKDFWGYIDLDRKWNKRELFQTET